MSTYAEETKEPVKDVPKDKWMVTHLHVGMDGVFVLPKEKLTFVGDREQFLADFGAPPEEVAQKLTGHLGKIPEISSGLEVKIKQTSTGAKIEVGSMDLTFDMTFDSAEKDLHFDLVTVTEAMQGTGIVKEALKGVLDATKGNEKIQQLSLYANLDVGGYAWAKYGFSIDGDAEDLEEKNKALATRLKQLLLDGAIAARQPPLIQQKMEEIQVMLASREKDPTLLWDVADLTVEVSVKPFICCPDHSLISVKMGEKKCQQPVLCRHVLTQDEELDWLCDVHGRRTEWIPGREAKLCKSTEPCGKPIVGRTKKRLSMVLLQGMNWDGVMPLVGPGVEKMKRYIKY